MSVRIVWAVLISQLIQIGSGYSLHPDTDKLPLHTDSIVRSERAQLSAVEDSVTWFNSAQTTLSKKLAEVRIEGMARNLILFIGDGMSLSTVTASRIFKGQRDGLAFGEEGQLHMETFPYIGTSKTYCSNRQVADSACTSTAYFTGTKGNVKTIGVSPAVIHDNCTLQMDPENQVSSILEWAQGLGMSTGIVTTTPVTEASPAGAFAHAANRDWENDARVEASGYDSATCHDIGKQLFMDAPGRGINVILGGGRENLTPDTVPDPEETRLMGRRKDGRNFPDEWIANKTSQGHSARYVTLRKELLELDYANTDFLLGLFAPGVMDYVDKQEANNDPSLAQMTEAAIKILSKNPKGYFLFVEGGRIDHAHHANNAQRALAETLEFDKAIQLADELSADEDTLLVVSSDHSHLLTIAGDQDRGSPILGLTGNTDHLDSLPATTLAYINGMGYRESVLDPGTGKCVRADVSGEDLGNLDFLQPSLYPRESSTHAGEDVLIFAKGPFAHLFTGIHEQNYIPHAMAYAACISPFGNNYCEEGRDSAAALKAHASIGLLLSGLFIAFRHALEL